MLRFDCFEDLYDIFDCILIQAVLVLLAYAYNSLITDNADSFLCGSWLDNGKRYGLEFSALRDGYTFHNCSGCSIYAAGLLLLYTNY